MRHFDEPNYGDFLAAGVPEKFLDHAGLGGGEDLPIIHLPEDWTPAHEMGIGVIRRVITQGIGLYVPPGLPDGFDLAWIQEEIGHARSLLFTGADTNLRNADLLGRASTAVEITTPASGSAGLGPKGRVTNLRWHVNPQSDEGQGR